jgi:hypothetical protein
MRNRQPWLTIDSPERATAALRRAAWFAVLHSLVTMILAGFLLFEGRSTIAGFDHKIVIIAFFLCFAAFRVAKGSMFWLCLLVVYETFNVLFCVLNVRFPEEAVAQFPSVGVGIVAWLVYASGMRGADYLRSHALRVK